jgi:hypothetical protein
MSNPRRCGFLRGHSGELLSISLDPFESALRKLIERFVINSRDYLGSLYGKLEGTVPAAIVQPARCSQLRRVIKGFEVGNIS